MGWVILERGQKWGLDGDQWTVKPKTLDRRKRKVLTPNSSSFSVSVLSITGFDGLDMLKLFLVAVDSAGSSIAAVRTYYGRCSDTGAQNCTNTTYLDVDVDRNVVQ